MPHRQGNWDRQSNCGLSTIGVSNVIFLGLYFTFLFEGQSRLPFKGRLYDTDARFI